MKFHGKFSPPKLTVFLLHCSYKIFSENGGSKWYHEKKQFIRHWCHLPILQLNIKSLLPHATNSLMGAENVKVGGILSPHLPVVENNCVHMSCNWCLLCNECWQTPYIVLEKHKCQASTFSLIRGEHLQHLNISSKIGVFVCVCICTRVCAGKGTDRLSSVALAGLEFTMERPAWLQTYNDPSALAFQMLVLKAGTITPNFIF